MKAAIFDMDGVLLDTERVMHIFWKQAAEEIGFKEYLEAGELSVGRNNDGVRKLFKERYPQVDFDKFHDRYSNLTQKYMAKYGVPVKDKVISGLEILAEKGYRIAVATSTSAIHALPQLDEAGITPFAEIIFTGDTVEHGKPDPEIYLKTCDALKISPFDAYGIEDSPNGIKSVYEARLQSVFIPDVTKMPEEYFQYIDLKYDSIEQFAHDVEYVK